MSIIIGTPVDIPANYATYDDIVDIFGVGNTNKWLDIDNTGDVTGYGTRLQAALQYADAYIDAKLRGGGYIIPLTYDINTGHEDDFIDPLITNCAATLAGLWLYSSRGIEDYKGETPLSKIKKNCDSTLKSIVIGSLLIDCALSE